MESIARTTAWSTIRRNTIGSVMGWTRMSQSVILSLLSGANIPRDLPLRGFASFVDILRIGLGGSSISSSEGVFSIRRIPPSVGPSTPVTSAEVLFEGTSERGPGREDFRLSVRSTTSCSLLRLTIRVDMLRTIVPALCSVDPAALGESDLRMEPDLRTPSLDVRVPVSACDKSSPNLELRVGVRCVENRTLRVRLPRLSDGVGVEGPLAPLMG